MIQTILIEFFFLTAIVGFALIIRSKTLKNSNDQSPQVYYQSLSLSLYFSIASIGCVTLLLYFFNQTTSSSKLYINVLFNLLNLRYFNLIKGEISLIRFFLIKKSSLSFIRENNWLLILFIGLLTMNLLYLLKSFIPWFDSDEIYGYGYFTKIMAHNWTKNEILTKGLMTGGPNIYPMLGEATFSHFYQAFNTPIYPKVIKFLFFINFQVFLYSYLSILKVRPTHIFLSIMCIIGLPELSYLMTSLKTDAFMFQYELASYLLIILGLKFYQENDERSHLYITSAFIFSVFSASVRFSGLYLFCCIFIITLTLFILDKKFRNFFKFKIPLLLLLSVMGASYYFWHAIEYNNPTYPLKSPIGWFSGPFQYDLKEWKGLYNLKTEMPSWLEAIYLIIHGSLGFETTLWDRVSFLPHAESKGNSIGWLHPLNLLIFVFPFYMRKSKLLALFFLSYCIGFIFWFNGITYTRVFLAGASLPILGLPILIEHCLNPSNRTKIFFTIIFSLGAIFSFTYNITYSFKKFPLKLTYFSEDQAKENFKLDVIKQISGFRPRMDKKLLKTELSELRQLTQHLDKQKVGLNFCLRSCHILFPNGVYFYEKKLSLSNYDCLLLENSLGTNIDNIGRYNTQKTKNFTLVCNQSVSL